MISSVPAALQSNILNAHLMFSRGRLPRQVSIYFHELLPVQAPELHRCLNYFARRGYRSVDAYQFATVKTDDLCIFISFDDCHRGWRQALPILREFDLTATFYVNSLPFRDNADADTIAEYRRRIAAASDYETLSRDELVEIASAGHRIGCHSHSHYMLSSLSPGDWDEEIRGSKLTLEGILGHNVSDFAWPYGMRRHFSKPLRRYCSDIGFKTIANAIPGCQKIVNRDPLNIHRSDWHFGVSLETNIAHLCVDARLFAWITGRSVLGPPRRLPA